jgi:hypothetical protein
MSFRDLGLINRRSGVAAREISLAVLAGSLSRLDCRQLECATRANSTFLPARRQRRDAFRKPTYTGGDSLHTSEQLAAAAAASGKKPPLQYIPACAIVSSDADADRTNQTGYTVQYDIQ